VGRACLHFGARAIQSNIAFTPEDQAPILAEKYNLYPSRSLVVWANEAIGILLYAVVEERAKVIRVTQRQQGLPEPKVLSVAESKEVALDELNLKGVWLQKEEI